MICDRKIASDRNATIAHSYLGINIYLYVIHHKMEKKVLKKYFHFIVGY